MGILVVAVLATLVGFALIFLIGRGQPVSPAAPENLGRLRKRNVAGQRGLALREFALGVESLDRFVRGAPLREVHECVFAILALHSEPTDPRL